MVSGPLKSSHPDIILSQSPYAPVEASEELPLVTISVMCRNAAPCVFSFFESLLHQSYPARKIQVCAVDLGSTDDTWERLAEMKALLEGSLGGFETFQAHGKHTGRAHKIAMRGAKGAFVLVASVETCLAKNALEAAVRIATTSSANIAAWEFKQVAPSAAGVMLPSEMETSWGSAYCLLYRHSALAIVGGFDTDGALGFEMELAYRLRDSGYRLVYCPSATFCRVAGKGVGAPSWRVAYPGLFYDIFMQLRYGTISQRLRIPLSALAFLRPATGARGKISRRGVIARLLRNGPRFVLSRKRSSRVFPICGWNLDVFSSMMHRLSQGRALGSRHSLVSIVVRTKKGREGFLRECLCSLANQSYPNIEVIVVEDGQTGFAQDILPRSTSIDAGRVHYIQNPHGGPSSTGNAGLERARGDFIAVLDDDNLLFPGHVERLMGLLEGDRALAGAYSGCYQVETEILSFDPFVYSEGRRKHLAHRTYSKPLLWADDFIPVTSMIFRRSCYEQYGGFDVKLKAAEAWDLWIRFSLNSRFAYVKAASAICRASADALGRRQWQEALEKNRRLVRDKQEGYKSRLPITESLELPSAAA